MTNPSATTALVVAGFGRRGRLSSGNEELAYLCKGRKIKPVVGDTVEYVPGPPGEPVIVESVCPRRNELRRSGHRGQPDTLAANVDLLLVIMAHQPPPEAFVTDRYLAAAEVMGCEAAVVLNKSDLNDTDDLLEEYAALGYPVLSTSASAGTGVDAIAALLAENTGILVGQSGVGKSSLINALIPGADAAVATISSASGEGRHTTTASMIHRVESASGEGRLIDSPGVRDFLPYLSDTREVQCGFREIDAAAAECRFANCHHLREPNCAVKAAVDSGDITQRRYDSYKRLYHMTQDAQQAD